MVDYKVDYMMEYMVKYMVDCIHSEVYTQKGYIIEEQAYRGIYTWKDIYAEVI